jgi:hypothetical protein
MVQNLLVAQLVEKFVTMYRKLRFIAVFTRTWPLNTLHTLPLYFFYIYLNIVLLSTLSSPNWSLSLRFLDYNCMYLFITHIGLIALSELI